MRRLLLVDDNAGVLETTARALEGAGYEVTSMATPLGVSNRVATGDFDAVVLDVMMPALSGEQLAGLLRKNVRTRDVVLVLYSAMEEEQLHRMSAELGVVYALKSDGVHALIDELADAFG